jgi:AcrR family transcriptional regulator
VSRRSSVEATVQGQPPTLLRERVRRQIASSLEEAAEEVFAAEGVHAAHVEHIARRAGVAVGTLYNYYKDRDALLAALLRTRREALFEELDRAEKAAHGWPIRDQLLAFTSAYIHFFVEHRTFYRILLEGELTRMQSTYPTATEEHTRSMRGFFDRVDTLIHRGIRSGELRGRHTDLDGWLLKGMLRAVTMRDLRENKPCEPKDVEHLVDVFLEGAGT